VIQTLTLEPQFYGGLTVGSSVQADAKFLRRVFLGLVRLTLATGGMAGLTTVQAMTDHTGSCLIFCQ
jgi:hypothetical protein